jgi:hypothetical protein
VTRFQSFPEERKEVVFCILQWNRKVAAHFDLIERNAWPIGALLEAEMMDNNFSDYKDTIHPVQVVEVLNGGKEYRCSLLAFDEDAVDVWNFELLHEVRGADLHALQKG